MAGRLWRRRFLEEFAERIRVVSQREGQLYDGESGSLSHAIAARGQRWEAAIACRVDELASGSALSGIRVCGLEEYKRLIFVLRKRADHLSNLCQ